jgi:membrane associated rhomboid family serine protease
MKARARAGSRRPAWGSAALFALLAAVYGVELAAGALGSDAGMLALGALPDDGAIRGEYWRLLTFGFLHSGADHLLLNGLLLLLAGPVVERLAGRLWLALLFLNASLASGAGILIKHQLWPASGVSVGASGGMFGLLGAALMLVLRAGGSRTTGAILTVTLLAALGYSLLPGVSMVGHLVGLAVGGGFGFFIGKTPRGGAPAATTTGRLL